MVSLTTSSLDVHRFPLPLLIVYALRDTAFTTQKAFRAPLLPFAFSCFLFHWLCRLPKTDPDLFLTAYQLISPARDKTVSL